MRFGFLFASLAASQLVVNYNHELEGRLETFEVEEMVVDPKGSEAKIGELKNPLSQRDASDNLFGRAALSAEGVLEVLSKRQNCQAGYGYCSSFGRCCPASTRCCSYGYCLPSDSRCCPSGPCKLSQKCCGNDRCIPSGAECCKGGRFCEAGNHCYVLPSEGNRPVCCTNSRCTAHVSNGITTFAPSRTTTRTLTTTRTQYYYWTVTWYYYYYYWTYSAAITASVVTSTRTSTRSVLSVSTTAAGAASSYFSSVSQTLSFSTPASATRLASLTGSTRTIGGGDDPGPTEPPTGGDSTADNGGAGGGGSDTGSPSPTPSESATAGSAPTNRPDTPGVAAALWSGVDGFMTLYLGLGLGIGALAIVL